MKFLLFILALLSSPLVPVAQTAEEILNQTESTYRKLRNYVDQGTMAPANNSSPVPIETTTYSIAMDRKGNVSYKLIKTLAGRTSGALFEKTAKDSLGVYTRLGREDAPFACKIEEAHPRLMGTGGSMFYLVGSMFYENTRSDSQSPTSMIQNYDTAKRLDDTTIHDEVCYVIKTRKTTIISQELVDQLNFKRDSTQGLLTLPPEQRGGPREVAGPKVSEHKYYIRQSDHMVIREESYHFKDGVEMPWSKSTLVLHPMYNVKGFKQHLRE
ncbi:MAG: hypothetical protein KA479_14365 [Saprospiraceae bacterium]|nr:hypothetical protein [Saprospiraceae bacterium]